ncbi:hypothetical protein GCM10010425_32520 [Streptomyces spororaveus]|uniref:Uncharacterized protein n=1 Tax=Streptomyces spororaveus TaxID=284039 RepID=A0ABQ3TK25_9ACTN|nr:hypothetical protein Sspor_63300 [Streptomyces spororaveus]
MTFPLWHGGADGEPYDLELFQLLPDGDTWTTRTVSATYGALPEEETAEYARLDRVTRPEGRCWTLWSPRRRVGRTRLARHEHQ